jgi:phosphate starvation-inducible protein PhoH
MAKKTKELTHEAPPKTLEGHIFYGLQLDPEQKKFRDAIWNDDIEIIFVDAKAGSGKTTIAVATAVMAVKYRKYDEIYYVMHSVGDAQGFLPGTISEKSSVWFEPLYQALIEAGEQPEQVVKSSSISSQKEGCAYVTAITDSYLRGSNLGGRENGAILIVDEAQNYDEFSLRKVLTRACVGTKVIVIGHTLQCDLPAGKRSGFKPCMDHFLNRNDPRVKFIELTTNHRSWVANTAD